METKESFFLGIRVAAWVEIVCFFLISFIIALIIGTNFNYFSVSPHPFWILVILISAQYGTLAGLLAALASTVVYLSGSLPKQSIVQEWNVYFFLLAKTPILWFITAIILGELRMKHIRERARLRELANTAKAREKKLADAYESLKHIKERLEIRVASETHTRLMILEALEEMEESKKKEIGKKACDLIKAFLAPEKSSIFMLDSHQLKCFETAGWGINDHFARSFSSKDPLYQEIVEKRGLFR